MPACHSLRVALRGVSDTLSLHCVPARHDDRCVAVPVYAPHYAFLDRLLHSVRQYGQDAPATRLIVVFDDRAPERAAKFCAAYPRSCEQHQPPQLHWEVTDLWRLTALNLGQHPTNASQLGDLLRRLKCLRPECASAVHRITKGNSGLRFTALVSKNVALYVSTLKKFLATVHTGCRRTWVLDAESVATAPFSFGSIFRDYWHADGAPLLHGPPSCRSGSRTFRSKDGSCRASLGEANARKLFGYAPMGDDGRGRSWNFNDLWMVRGVPSTP